jgi:hypothetical protein
VSPKHACQWALLACAALAAGCPKPAPAESTGCKTDADCKGNRVCANAQCVDPPPDRHRHRRDNQQQNQQQPPPPTPTPPARPVTPPRSAVPSEADWRVVREVTVTGSSRMNCETKKIREWVRVRCYGKNESGSTPKGVTVVSTSVPDATFPNAAGGEVTLLYPFTEGTTVDAIFRWSGRERHQYHSQWPSGAAEPAAKGEFLGVPPPSDPNRVWPCQSDNDCNPPNKCGHMGNCMVPR